MQANGDLSDHRSAAQSKGNFCRYRRKVMYIPIHGKTVQRKPAVSEEECAKFVVALERTVWGAESVGLHSAIVVAHTATVCLGLDV